MSSALASRVKFHGCHLHLSPLVSNRNLAGCVMCVCAWKMWLDSSHSTQPQCLQDIVFLCKGNSSIFNRSPCPRAKHSLIKESPAVIQSHNLPWELKKEKKIASKLKTCKTIFSCGFTKGHIEAIPSGCAVQKLWLNTCSVHSNVYSCQHFLISSVLILICLNNF